jgi:hypothetical protein
MMVSVPLQVDAVEIGGAQIFPDFVAGTFEYTIVGMDDTLPFNLTMASGLSCLVSYGGTQYRTCDLSTITFPVVQQPSPLTITLYVSTDSIPLNVTYTFQLRKVGCFVSALQVVGTGGIVSCSSASGSYPASVSCIASDISQAFFAFDPFNSCQVQIQYSTDGASWVNCGPSLQQPSVNATCASPPGVTQYTIQATDPYISSFTSQVALIAATNGLPTCIAEISSYFTVNWGFAVADAQMEPAFSADINQYNITASCAQFTATASIVSGCDNCQVTINGNNNNQITFDATTTGSFGVQVCLGSCSSGIFILYSYSVVQSTCALMYWSHVMCGRLHCADRAANNTRTRDKQLCVERACLHCVHGL